MRACHGRSSIGVFRDREDLDEQIRARIIERLMAVLAPVLVPDGTIKDTVAQAAETFVGWVRENPQLHSSSALGCRGATPPVLVP